MHYQDVHIKVENSILKGFLRHSKTNKAIILFSHGSGSSRLSSRNNYVAEMLFEAGFSSLLFDLLTEEEDCIYDNRFDITLFTKRLLKVTEWVLKNKQLKKLPIGYFGASTGAASALSASILMGNAVKAVVSRGGRSDLSTEKLSNVTAPTLLIVGGNDDIVIEINKIAQQEINATCELSIIEGASHLFSEPGKLAIVAQQTISWFNKYLLK